MRKHVEESVATGAAAGRGRGGRFSAGRKREVVTVPSGRPNRLVANRYTSSECARAGTRLPVAQAPLTGLPGPSKKSVGGVGRCACQFEGSGVASLFSATSALWPFTRK